MTISKTLPSDSKLFSSPPFANVCVHSPSKADRGSYYLLTDIHHYSSIYSISNTITFSIYTQQRSFYSYMSIISIANQMFKNSLPMSGKELRVLRKTASRLISSSPTTLIKK